MNIRFFVFGSIALFFIGVFIIVGYGVSKSPTEQEPSKPAEKTYNLSDIAKHSTPADCWMAINGKVYDLTTYIEHHPTKPEVLTKHCGTEASGAYKTKGGMGEPHYPSTDKKLPKYKVGIFKSEANN